MEVPFAIKSATFAFNSRKAAVAASSEHAATAAPGDIDIPQIATMIAAPNTGFIAAIPVFSRPAGAGRLTAREHG
jgi:hypothetical protein